MYYSDGNSIEIVCSIATVCVLVSQGCSNKVPQNGLKSTVLEARRPSPSSGCHLVASGILRLADASVQCLPPSSCAFLPCVPPVCLCVHLSLTFIKTLVIGFRTVLVQYDVILIWLQTKTLLSSKITFWDNDMNFRGTVQPSTVCNVQL